VRTGARVGSSRRSRQSPLWGAPPLPASPKMMIPAKGVATELCARKATAWTARVQFTRYDKGDFDPSAVRAVSFYVVF
jgi:hypothetical protein